MKCTIEDLIRIYPFTEYVKFRAYSGFDMPHITYEEWLIEKYKYFLNKERSKKLEEL